MTTPETTWPQLFGWRAGVWRARRRAALVLYALSDRLFEVGHRVSPLPDPPRLWVPLDPLAAFERDLAGREHPLVLHGRAADLAQAGVEAAAVSLNEARAARVQVVVSPR